MKFDTKRPSPPPPAGRSAQVGDVYAAKGGKGESRYWLVVSVVENKRIVVLGLDEGGAVVGGASYGAWAMKDRPLLGRCDGLENMSLEITWKPL